MELFTLIKMLFKGKPSDFKEPILKPMKHFPFKNFKFMMWCGYMIYRESKQETIENYMKTNLGKKSKRHETFHLKQAQYHAKDSWIRYYWRYFCEWLKGNPITSPSSSAYSTIPFEVEAYALEDKQEALDNYDTTLLKSKYTLKNRKKLYKEHKKDWKRYIKSL